MAHNATRELTEIELHLVSLDFIEMHGKGLWAQEKFGTVVDTTNTYTTVYPYLGAEHESIVGHPRNIKQLDSAIERSNTDEYHVRDREEAMIKYEANRLN